MQIVARGRTIKLTRFENRADLIEALREAAGVAGRVIIGGTTGDGEPVELVMLIDKGSVVAASVNGVKPGRDELGNLLNSLNGGYIEVQEIDHAGMELEREFNSQFFFDRPIDLNSLLEASTSNVEPESVESVSETEAAAKEVSVAEKEEAETEITAESSEATATMHEAVTEKAEEQVGPAATSTREAEAAVEGSVETVRGETQTEAVAEVAKAEATEEQAEAAEAKELGETATEAATEQAVAASQTQAVTREVEEAKVKSLKEVTVEKKVIEEGRKLLEKLPEDVRSFIDPEILEKVSNIYADNAVNVYMIATRSGHIVRFLRDVDPIEALKDLIRISREEDTYARLLASFDTNVEAYMISYRGILCSAVITPYLQPLTIVEKGMKALTKYVEEAEKAKQKKYSYMILPEEDLDEIFGCSLAYEEAIKKIQSVQKEEKSPRTRRRGFLSRLFRR